MKKLITLVALITLCISNIQAEREAWQKRIYLKAGVNFANMVSKYKNGDSDKKDRQDVRAGYNLTVGHQKQVGKLGGYWGQELSLSTRGWKEGEGAAELKALAHSIQLSPITFGWRAQLLDILEIDPHAGVYGSLDFLTDIDYDANPDVSNWRDYRDDREADHFRPFDLGMNLGIGFWIDEWLNIDFNFQRGFVTVFKYDDDDDHKFLSSNFMIRLGIAL